MSLPESASGQVVDCDLLLTGGRVIDPETGLDDVRDVAVTGGTVVAVGGPTPRAARTLDATGRVVTVRLPKTSSVLVKASYRSTLAQGSTRNWRSARQDERSCYCDWSTWE
jgi:hypothetical protein